MTQQTLRDDLRGTIALAVHTSLRKAIDSHESAVAWRAIGDLPDREWSIVCGVAADAVLFRLSDRLRDERSASAKWMTGDGPLPRSGGE